MPAPTHPLQLVIGLVVWSVWFIVLYGGLSVGCAIAPPGAASGPFTWINALLLLLTVPVSAWLLYRAYRFLRYQPTAHDELQDGHFIARVAAAVYLLAGVSTLAIGLPVLLLPPCF